MAYSNFSGGPVVKNLPSNAGDAGSIPGQGTKIPHAAGKLSPSTATTEPMRLNYRACVPQTCSGARAPQLERSPHAARKIPHTATKIQRSQNKFFKKNGLQMDEKVLNIT